jgi:hypothetical protein
MTNTGANSDSAAATTAEADPGISDHDRQQDADSGKPSAGRPTGGRRSSVATRLIDTAREDYELGITDSDEPFAHRKGSHVAMMLRGGKAGLRAELARRYFDEHRTAAPKLALTDACATLDGFAAQAAPQRLHLRVADAADSIWIDMGDPGDHVIHIEGGGWDIRTSAPVLFRRTRLTQAMPEPIAGGDLSALWEFVPIEEEDRPLVLAWLISALVQVDSAHTILSLVAEHGSIKSTTTKHMVNLIDPTNPVVRKAPRNAEEWITAANASWVVGLDNLSGAIPQWLSDCLCRASTGDGDVRRQLYTDGDVSVISFRRVILFNGIDVIVSQGDLADRLVRVKLPRVQRYLKDGDVARRWAMEYPNIFGGLLDLAAKVHQRLRTIEVIKPPRMADFAAVLACVDEELGTHGLSHYRNQARRIAADTLDHPFISKLVEERRSFEAQTGAEIRAALTPDDKNWHAPRGWPTSPQAVSGNLTRHAPALRAQGWEISEDGGHNHRNVLRWTIRPPEKPGTEASRPSQASPGGHHCTTPDTFQREANREDVPGCDAMSTRTGAKDQSAAHTRSSQLQQSSPPTTPLIREDEDASPARAESESSPIPGAGWSAPREDSADSPSAGIADRLRRDIVGERPANHCAGEDPDAQVDHAPENRNIPGDVTESTPGLSPAVLRAVAKGRAACAASGQSDGTEPTSTPGPRDV